MIFFPNMANMNSQYFMCLQHEMPFSSSFIFSARNLCVSLQAQIFESNIQKKNVTRNRENKRLILYTQARKQRRKQIKCIINDLLFYTFFLLSLSLWKFAINMSYECNRMKLKIFFAKKFQVIHIELKNLTAINVFSTLFFSFSYRSVVLMIERFSKASRFFFFEKQNS